MRKAADKGKHLGRSKGKESTAQFLAKTKNQAISAALEKGRSIRQVSRETGAAINTVRKVKELLVETEEIS